jgi:hypothetical protein
LKSELFSFFFWRCFCCITHKITKTHRHASILTFSRVYRITTLTLLLEIDEIDHWIETLELNYKISRFVLIIESNYITLLLLLPYSFFNLVVYWVYLCVWVCVALDIFRDTGKRKTRRPCKSFFFSSFTFLIYLYFSYFFFARLLIKIYLFLFILFFFFCFCCVAHSIENNHHHSLTNTSFHI